MKTETKVRITNENVSITENNVQHIGECIALSATKKSFFHLDYESVLAFFNINAEKTNQLIYSMLELDTYIEDETLRVIISKYKEIGLEREARDLLNMLTKKRRA